jgi:hypothetical protein
MIEDKYIGLGLAIGSSLALGRILADTLTSGSSFVITKKVDIAEPKLTVRDLSMRLNDMVSQETTIGTCRILSGGLG